jgi:predicted RNase H-like HicB family nuclease
MHDVYNEVMKFLVTMSQDEDGMYVVECPALPGCLSQGKTRAEALENIREAILLSLENRKVHGLPSALEVAEVDVAIAS